MDDLKSHRIKTTAIILSGGKGTRAGTDLPKQYVRISGRPLLSCTLEAFQNSRTDEILIAAAPEYLQTCREMAEEYGISKVKEVLSGGKERYHSVRNALQYLCRTKGDLISSGQEMVLIHDGARPFIKPDMINRIIAETEQCGAVIAASPCTDTIKLVDEEGHITATTDRRLTWAAQTPQAFFLQDIAVAYENLFENPANRNLTITDDAMVYQLAFPERSVKVIDAGRDNIKITTPQDFLLAESMLKQLL